MTFGNEVGARIRFTDKTQRNTAIKVMTDGILLNEIQKDPMLKAYDAIIIDEAHERSLNIDFILGHLRKLSGKRPDLKIIITSATINTERFSEAFFKAPIIEVSGRMYPVETHYRPLESFQEAEGALTYLEAASQLIQEIIHLQNTTDILVFLPGERDIHELRNQLEEHSTYNCEILPLYSRLSNAEQQRIFRSGTRQRIILSTNIAETSLTVPNIGYVIDTGQARISRYSPHSHTQRLPIEPIAQSSADQRKGRCGRVSNGVCYRLYSEQDFLSRPQFTTPEIHRSNLASVILRMLAFRLGDIHDFPFIDPPTEIAIRSGYRLLNELGAVAESSKNTFELTRLGHQLAQLPIDPSIARMLLQAREENALEDVLIIAAGLSIQDPRERPAEQAKEADSMHKRFIHKESDFLTLLNIWKSYHQEMEQLSQSKLRKFCKQHFISFQRIREWREIYEQLRHILKDLRIATLRPLSDRSGENPQSTTEDTHFHLTDQGYTAIHRSILSGLLSNVAIKEGSNQYRGPRNRNALLFPGSGLYNPKDEKRQRKKSEDKKRSKPIEKGKPEWIVCGEWMETSRLFARTAAKVEVQWIEELAGDLLKLKHSEPFWSTRSAAALCKQRKLLFGLELGCSMIGLTKIDPDEATDIFIRNGLIEQGIREKPDFLAHNIAVCEKMSSELARRRIGSSLEVEERIYHFYRDRLQAVGSYAELRSFAKQKHGGSFNFLNARLEDLLPETNDAPLTEAFPRLITIGGIELPLTYQNDPDSEADGVTLHIPVNHLSAIQQHTLDWAIPGHLEETIESLLRALPKSIRTRLHPLRERAAELFKWIEPSEHTLCDQLKETLLTQYEIRISDRDWSISNIPDYLKLRIQVETTKGKKLCSGYDLTTLRTSLESEAASSSKVDGLNTIPAWQQAAARIERTHLKSWDFADLPEAIDLTSAAELPLKAFPGLVLDNDGNVHLRLLSDKASALAATQKGFPALCEIGMSRDIAWLQGDLKAIKRLGTLLLPLGDPETVRTIAWKQIRSHLFRCQSLLPLRKTEFDSTLARAKEESCKIIPLFLDRLQALLEARQQICLLLEQKRTSNAITYPGMRAHMESITPPDLLEEYTFAELPDLTRFLKAMYLRAERAKESIQRDMEKSKRVEPFEQKLIELKKSAKAPEQLKQVKHYQMLLEEFKVSIFAQELGTAHKVSEKRLMQLIGEIQSK
ncbi:MAG: ATP-dependent helicase HrpA [Lentimonas sp.]